MTDAERELLVATARAVSWLAHRNGKMDGDEREISDLLVRVQREAAAAAAEGKRCGLNP